MQITEIDGDIASCHSAGITRAVNLFMFEHGVLKPGDYVLVHVGYAIQKIDFEAAQLAWNTEREMRGATRGDLNA